MISISRAFAVVQLVSSAGSAPGGVQRPKWAAFEPLYLAKAVVVTGALLVVTSALL